MEEKINRLLSKLKEVEVLLGQPDVFADQKKYKEISQEYSRLSGLRDLWNYYLKTFQQLAQNKELLISEKDVELIEVIKEDIANLEKELENTKIRLELILVPPDPRDSRNVIMEIRAGTGGDEAALFVGDLVRMYQYYATNKGWSVEIISTSESEKGGYREFIMSLSGHNV
jgi:peptide chain release factor 1